MSQGRYIGSREHTQNSIKLKEKKNLRVPSGSHILIFTKYPLWNLKLGKWRSVWVWRGVVAKKQAENTLCSAKDTGCFHQSLTKSLSSALWLIPTQGILHKNQEYKDLYYIELKTYIRSSSLTVCMWLHHIQPTDFNETDFDFCSLTFRPIKGEEEEVCDLIWGTLTSDNICQD